MGKSDLETLGLFKVDLLGLGALTQLDLALRLLQTHYERELSLDRIPQDDRRPTIRFVGQIRSVFFR
ncbi:MAG: hypothetical protein Ct9H300mP25_12270 [Acidobacteriota bacterium]|nr:MAG: hypothetical protein Ct9H300mP25_12270 [Acidobacteriota bacterium]